MPRNNWKHIKPISLIHAMELCLRYAKDKKNLSIVRVADLMALSSHTSLYKWMSTGRMPASLILPFEHGCGVNYMTQYLAASDGQLLVKIPRGNSVGSDDLIALQTNFNDALNLVSKFYKGDADADETLAALADTMTDIAGHQENVKKHAAPELAL